MIDSESDSRPVIVGIRAHPAGLPRAWRRAADSVHNEVLRRQCDEELAQAMSALDADIDATGTLLDGDAQRC
jgi:hypothetical protein